MMLAVTTPLAETCRNLRRLIFGVRRCLSALPISSLFIFMPPLPELRIGASSCLPAGEALRQKKEEHIDEDAEGREDQDYREELRHLDHRRIGRQAIAET